MSSNADFRMPTPAQGTARSASQDLYLKATEAAKAGDPERAVQLCREALTQAARSGDRFNQQFVEGRLGHLLLEAGHGAEAIAVLGASVVGGSEIPATLTMLTNALIVADDYGSFERLMRDRYAKAIADAKPPDFVGAEPLFRLAGRSLALAHTGIVDDRPITAALQIAQALGSDRGLVLTIGFRRGEVQEVLGDEVAAIATYESLVKAGSSHEPTIDRLLALLQKSGRLSEAATVVRELKSRKLTGQTLETLLQRESRIAKELAKKQPTSPVKKRQFDPVTFGRRLATFSVASEVLNLEATEIKGERFVELDALTSELIARRLRNDPIGRTDWRTKTAAIEGVSPAQRDLIERTFSCSELEKRGVWFLPKELPVAYGLLSPTSSGESASVPISGSADATYLWSVVAPLYRALRRPMELREASGAKAREQQKAEWQGVAGLYESLGLDARIELDSMEYGGGWSRLDASQRQAVIARLTQALTTFAPDAAARYRALQMLELANSYYANADADGRALRKRVITARLRPAFIGYFGGDWRAVLDYLGEEPHPAEFVATGLPETKIMTAGAARIAQAAAELGLPTDQAGLISAAIWGPTGESPVEARLAALKGYWEAIDVLHARQERGMPALWGLVEEGWEATSLNHGGGEHNSGLFLKVLSPETQSEISRLWGGYMLPKWPDRIVSPISPHVLVAEAIGPALKFWHGVGLTTWFLCEGPYSRTSLEEMEGYYARDLAGIDGLGCPVDRSLFRDLIKAQSGLRKRAVKPENQQTVDVGHGVKIQTWIAIGPSQYDGFEHLRDVVTRHRRVWAAQYLDLYLHQRWETDVREGADAFHRLTNDAGKPPTFKAFARKGVSAVNHWFGGDLSAFYAAIGAKPTSEVARADRLMPQDRHRFVTDLVSALRPQIRSGIVDPKQDSTEWALNNCLSDVARFALGYVQLWEALGHRPERSEAAYLSLNEAQTIRAGGNARFETAVLSDDPDRVWSIFSRALEYALGQVPTARRLPTATPVPADCAPKPEAARNAEGPKSADTASDKRQQSGLFRWRR